jgi:DNA-binding NtrC family response regulator
MEKHLAYNWPGDVRELGNSIQRGVVLADTQSIGMGALFHERSPENHGRKIDQQGFAGDQGQSFAGHEVIGDKRSFPSEGDQGISGHY